MKKIILCIAMILLSAQSVSAKNCWVWTGENMLVYVEDTELEWNEDYTEFSITVIDVYGESNKVNRNKFYFYERDDNWFYNIGGTPEIMPVSKNNVSGYILEFAQNFIEETF